MEKKNKEPILVAIHCLVYNHEPYLHDCCEGFVMQKTNFRFVAIVHEDCSTDNSAAIVREYETKYPDIFRPIYETENQWSKHDGSLGRIMNAAIDTTGAKYIAMCDGDDYWTDPYKLQKQVDFMETHPEYDMVCARFDHLKGETGEIQNFDLYDGIISPEVDGIELNHEHFLCRALPHPCTVMYRSGTLYDNPYWQKLKYKFDVTIYWCFMMTHRIWLMNEKMAMYRKHDDSVTSAAGWMSRKYDAILDLYYNLPDDPVLRRLGASAYRSQTIVYWQNSKRFSMKKFMEQMKGYAAFKPTIHNMITLCVRVAQARRAKK